MTTMTKGFSKAPKFVGQLVHKGYTSRQAGNAKSKKFKALKLQHNVQAEADNQEDK